MNAYRRGAVLGLTIAETFIILTFLLLIAMLGLIQPDEPLPEPSTANPPRVWYTPEEIEALVNDAKDARAAAKNAEQGRNTAEGELAQAQRNLAKGINPPCWYQVISANEGKTRERPYYVFNVAIHEYSIELAPRTAPPGGAFDDGGGPYADEWKRLHIEGLPYGKNLSDNEFTQVVSDLVAQGRNRQVRTYDCVFSVMVWDKTPDHAKKRWKDAHDHLIEGVFGAYTVQDLEWKGVE